jgi:hypothetical protein
MNAEFGITDSDREVYDEFIFIRHINEKLSEAEELAIRNPDAWTDADEFLSEWETG